MLSSLSLLAAENRILEQLPAYFGVQLELVLPLILAIIAMVLGVLYGKSIRMEDHGWRVGLVAGSFLAALTVILFWEYKLGVDLKGGAILVYEVDEVETAANHPQGLKDDWEMSELMQVLKLRLNPDGLKEIVIRPFGPKQIEIVIPEVDKEEVDATKKMVTEAGVLRFLILADSPTRDQALFEIATAQAQDATDPIARLARNVKDPVDPKGEKIIGVWVDLKRQPGKAEPQPFLAEEALFNTKLRNGLTGELIDLDRTPQDRDEFQSNALQYFFKRGISVVQVLMVADPEIDIRGSDLALASAVTDEQGRPEIRFVMKADSVWKMRDLTNQNKPVGAVTRKLGIIWDNDLVSAPNIKDVIGAEGRISGQFTQKEVREKVELLRSGSMPVVLMKDPISDDRIGATLGADTVRKGSQSIIISLSIVLAFVLVYYRTAGVVACFALTLNVMLTVALMFALKAPFTLPGLAGLVLTVGMSVDANVLIYERIREELEKGASLRMSIRNGFDKALVTIIDSNVTTLITAVILYVIGTDQVRGFGMTLILGIVTSMFTAIFASRAILEIGERAYRWQTLSMMKFFDKANIDWIGLFRPAAVLSTVLIVAGLIATVWRGAGIFDIDLAGGTSVQFILDPREYSKVTEKDVRDRMKTAFEGVTVASTKSKADHNVYQKFLATTESTDGTPAEEQMVWKVDSSLEDVTQLQEVVRKAFRTKDDREGLQTYGLTIGAIKEIQPTTPAPPVIAPPPSIGPAVVPPVTPETPKVEPTKEETPKVEPAKPDPDKPRPPMVVDPADEPAKPETPKPETPKADPPKSDESKDSSDCQEEPDAKKAEDTKAEDTKAEDTKPEVKTDEKKSEPKADPDQPEVKPEVKPAPAEADAPKPEDPKPETPKTETPKAETPATPEDDPAKLIPALPPLGPMPSQPVLGGNVIKTQVELKLGNTKISGHALKDRIREAAEVAVKEAVLVDVSAPGWNGIDNKSYSDWTVTFSLPKADAEKVLEKLEQDLANEPVWQTSSKIGGQVSFDTRSRAIFAIIGSLLGMIAYMWIRFHKISWGIAAAVALAHDALVMLGAIAISYWLAPFFGFLMIEEFKISLPVVAAFLTLIGYSVNDTIVIFDRIREIRGKSPEVSGAMINLAVNQTLSRTFLTAGTSLMVIVILYFMGGSGIHAFAFSLVIGVISGTYSTVFIAAPLLVYLIGLDQQTEQRRSVPAKTPTTTTRGAA